MGEEPHDERAWQGGNIGPDVDVPEPPSTLGVQLYIARTELNQAVAVLERIARLGIQKHDGTSLTQYVCSAQRALNRAIEHYDNDKPAWRQM